MLHNTFNVPVAGLVKIQGRKPPLESLNYHSRTR